MLPISVSSRGLPDLSACHQTRSIALLPVASVAVVEATPCHQQIFEMQFRFAETQQNASFRQTPFHREMSRIDITLLLPRALSN